MKRLITAAVVAGALVAAAPAGAQGNGNSNGCGELFRNLGAPGFGQAVSEVAREGGFDEFVALICRDILP